MILIFLVFQQSRNVVFILVVTGESVRKIVRVMATHAPHFHVQICGEVEPQLS